MEKMRYKVEGRFEDRRIDENVEAFSIKQAKLKGAFQSGMGGNNVRKFYKSKNIRVMRI
ncbi:MAG: hypothetical protein AABY22_03820 [Nanoarchaeota archaeon]